MLTTIAIVLIVLWLLGMVSSTTIGGLNAAAIWIESRIGIDSILSTARRLGVSTPLHRYPTTALGASEMNLLELAGPVPSFPAPLEARITAYLQGRSTSFRGVTLRD